MTRPNPLKVDPTRTGMARRRFRADMLHRFDKLKREITKLVVDDDAFGLKQPKQPTFNLASTQVNITDQQVKSQIKEIQASIDPEDLLELDEQPHITVRYGLHDLDSERVRWIVQQYSSIAVTLGKLSLFRSPKQDVLKVEVDSSDLDRINKHLGIFPNTETFKDYTPHLTVAYLKPGAGYKYAGLSGLEGKKLLFKSLYYSDSDRQQTKLTFNWLNLSTANLSSLQDHTDWMIAVPVRNSASNLILNTVWQFLSDDQKLQEFIDWLRNEISITILAKAAQYGATDDDHWLNEYIYRTYQQGMARAFDAVRKPALTQKLDFYEGTKQQFLQSSFGRPVSLSRVKLLASRAFADLQGVTDQMATQMQRTLVDGFIRGESPRDIARSLNQTVDNIGKKRARTIANTEIVRAHNEGQLQAMEDLGVTEVGVAVEWETSGLGTTALGNPSPCPLCAALKGIVVTTREAKGMLPRHPNCRCSWIPANVGESITGQKRTRLRIQQAIRKSISAERPKKKKRTIAEQKRRTKWAGSTKKIAKKRPKSIV